MDYNITNVCSRWKGSGFLFDHDRLFKYLIENFFEEFMMLFLPEAVEVIDFSQVTFLQQDLP